MPSLNPRSMIVCFGFDKRTMRKQPWHMTHGLASGLVAHGHAVCLATDGADLPDGNGYEIRSIATLFIKGRPSPALRTLIDDHRPECIYLVTGATALGRLRPLGTDSAWTLVLTSPRIHLREWARLGLRGLWQERDLLALPLANALLPGTWLRRAFHRSQAHDIIYTSIAARHRYQRLGLPRGRVLRPQVAPQDVTPGRYLHPPMIVYLGPPLALRGVELAIEAFEQATARGLDARLLLLLRPDVHLDRLERCLLQTARSPAADRIICQTNMLEPAELQALMGAASVFLLPFKLTVSDVPLVVIEAGLTGKPLVVLDTAGVSEVAASFNGHIARRPSELPGLLQHALTIGAQPVPPATRQHWTLWPAEVGRLLDAEEPSPADALGALRLIAITGVDGSGKTFILRHLQRELHHQGIDHRHVWSRFRNYLSKPLLGLARLTGHNRKEWIGGVKIGLHDFRNVPWLAWPFLVLQFADNVIDILVRYRRRPDLAVGDRCVLDTLVDLAADTGRERFVFGAYGRMLLKLLPRPNRIVILERSVEDIVRDRPDAVADRMFMERRRLFRAAAERFGIPIIANDGTPEAVCARILPFATDKDDNRSQARSA